MPVYEYRCVECADTFERLVPMSSNGSPTECPQCGAQADKQFSTFAALGTERTVTASRGGCCGAGGSCACAG